MGFAFLPVFSAIGISGPIASLLVSVVLAAGAMLLGWLLAPKPPTPDDGKTAVQESTPARNFGYGLARIGGAMILRESYKGSTIFKLQAIASHRVVEFVSFFLHEDEVHLKALGDRFGIVGSAGDGRYGNDKVAIYWRYGNDPEDPITPFCDLLGPTIWPISARGDGVAQIGLTAADSGADDQYKRFPFGEPELSAVVKFYEIYDWRDPTQVLDNPSTWKWSKNSALCIAHWLCHSEFGYRKPWSKAIAPLLDQWTAEADICDEQIPLAAGGSQARYELGGTGTTKNEPKAILAQMLASCDGWIVTRGDGSVLLRVGKFRPSGVVLTDDDIEGYYYQSGVNDEDAVNRLDVQFNSPDHKYAMVECDPFNNDDDQQLRGTVREQQYQLEWVQHFARARRIAKREFKRLQEPFRGTLSLKLSGLNAAYERWIYIVSDTMPSFSNRYVENRAARFDLEAAGMEMDFVGVPEDIEDWGISDEGQPPPVLDIPADGELPVPANLNVVRKKFVSDPGPPAPTYSYRLALSWDKGDPFLDLKFSARWRVADNDAIADGNQPGPWHEEMMQNPIEATALRWQGETGVIDAAGSLEVQIASVKNQTYSDWSPVVVVPALAATI